MITPVLASTTSFTSLQCSTVSRCPRKGHALFPLWPPSLTASRKTTSVPELGLCPKPREDCSLLLREDLPQGTIMSTNPL
uniref:Sperm tail PG-rich repeat containing 1 n=1 Tax=Rousettus aegyptiacus TaxID=9407 RepID=A0A7J8KHQ3_ROUAE|nr:sperm tail PG-rich repeat containing 1 [Rousettus aegyptiacus]